MFKRICAEAGIGDGWTPRELRTTFVSLMSHQGVAIEKIARLIGHATTRATEIVYRRELRSVITTGAQIMDQLFSGTRPSAHASHRSPGYLTSRLHRRQPSSRSGRTSRNATIRRSPPVQICRIGMPINLIGICCPRCTEHLFPGAWPLQTGDAETSMPAVPATASNCLNARPAAGHGRLRNAARFCAPRGTAESVRQANWLAGPSVCSERSCGPGLLCSVRGHHPEPPVTGYLCRYCRQRSAPGKAPAGCPLCGAPLDVRPAVSGSGWMRQPMIPTMTRLSCGTIRCQINGTYVPVAEFELAAGDWIYFSPKVLLWTDPATTLTIPQPSRGRSTGMIEAHGPGHTGVAENRAGEVIALPLRPAQPACVRPGRFLCATGTVKYRWRPSEVSYSTMAAEREYPAGRYLLNLTAAGRHGLVLLHASGDAFIRDLADSESVLVSPASLLYWEDTVYLSLHLESPYVPGQHVRRVFWQSTRIWLRACGPGRVAIDSASGQAEDARTADRESFASWQRWGAPATTTTRAE